MSKYKAIVIGDKRKFLSVEIDISDHEEFENFDIMTDHGSAEIKNTLIIELID